MYDIDPADPAETIITLILMRNGTEPGPIDLPVGPSRVRCFIDPLLPKI